MNLPLRSNADLSDEGGASGGGASGGGASGDGRDGGGREGDDGDLSGLEVCQHAFRAHELVHGCLHVAERASETIAH